MHHALKFSTIDNLNFYWGKKKRNNNKKNLGTLLAGDMKITFPILLL